MFVDLIEVQERISEETGESAVAIDRVEQLYPFPEAAIEDEISRYSRLEEIVWLQEEPANMGARDFAWPCLTEMSKERFSLRYIGRPRRASPAEGSASWHKRNQQAIVEHAFSFEK